MIDLKKYILSYTSLILMAGFILALDQWTKFLVRSRLPFGEIWSPWSWLTPYARIVNWKNSGAAFGMLQGFGGVFTLLAIVVAVAIFYYYPQVSARDWYLKLAMGLQLGGALGNLVDRLTQQGHVTDFISIGNFPVFNVADSSISIGVAVLVIGIWIKDRQDKNSLPAEPDTGDPLSNDISTGNVSQESRGE